MKMFDLSIGVSYRVAREFEDFEGSLIPQGQRLTFVSQSFDLESGNFLLVFRERKLLLREEAGLHLIEHLPEYLSAEQDLSTAAPVAAGTGCGVACPNCSNPMVLRQVELFYRPEPADIEVCLTCNVLWFDHAECLGMTARSVLDLFQYLNQSGMKPRMPLSAGSSCPHCRIVLEKTQDMQRATRFSYWRCPEKHGELYTFTQFLLNKNFIRSPTPEDLAKLRKLVRQVTCSQCGGPIDLIKDTVCPHCSTAIALVDPDGIAKAVQELEARDAQQSRTASEAQMRAAMIMVQNESRAKKYTDEDVPSDLLSAAVSAISTFLAR